VLTGTFSTFSARFFRAKRAGPARLGPLRAGFEQKLEHDGTAGPGRFLAGLHRARAGPGRAARLAISSPEPEQPLHVQNRCVPLAESMRAMSTAAGGMLRARLRSVSHVRGGDGEGAGQWSTPRHEERPKGYLFNRSPPPGESRKWEDWELPCYVISFLTVVILGVGLNAKPDLTIETWAPDGRSTPARSWPCMGRHCHHRRVVAITHNGFRGRRGRHDDHDQLRRRILCPGRDPYGCSIQSSLVREDGAIISQYSRNEQRERRPTASSCQHTVTHLAEDSFGVKNCEQNLLSKGGKIKLAHFASI
jgi:hypothetical protein